MDCTCNEDFSLSCTSKYCQEIPAGCTKTVLTADGCCEVCDEAPICEQNSCSVTQKLTSKVGECDIVGEKVKIGFCSGTCASETLWNAEKGENENSCGCCKPKIYSEVNVEVVCDGVIENKLLRIAEECECNCGDSDVCEAVRFEELY